MKIGVLLVCLLRAPLEKVEAFFPANPVAPKTQSVSSSPCSDTSLGVSLSLPSSTSSATSSDSSSSLLKSYEYDGWNLTYRYKTASSGYEDASPILLIHPVGIGLSSWFWERLMAQWTGPAIYAPNLIGCGISEGGDAWNPDERGLSFPLGWAKGCEALMKKVATENTSAFSLFKDGQTTNRKWTIMSQGGLAPVAVLMASRNPEMIEKMILASPPTWKDMTTAVPEKELSRNSNFLKNPVWGPFAFDLLESRGAIEFFSNQFLFSQPCDPEWLDKAQNELGIQARPPVIAFNSGFCQHRSFEEELRDLTQQTLILSGDGDKRPREEYSRFLNNCRQEVIPGLNVLPWESTLETVQSIKMFIEEV